MIPPYSWAVPEVIHYAMTLQNGIPSGRTWEEPGNIYKGDEWNVESIAEADETCSFDG